MSRTDTVIINIEHNVKITGQGKRLFIATFLCQDQDGKPSCYSEIFRADNKKIAQEEAKKKCGTDMFDNVTRLDSMIDVGVLR